jgi:Tfp pilus assembly protein PilV
MRHDRLGPTRRHARAGSALLDVVVSLVILGLSGTGLITLLGQTAHSVRQVRDTEREVRRASDQLARLAVADRAQLLSMVGQTVSRGWIVTIGQSSPDLFDVTIADTTTTARVLHTTLYRPDSTHADRP